MTSFSANLGLLWSDHKLPEAIRTAHKFGFDAVECHWPYNTAFEEVRSALRETGMTMLGLNTIPGNISAGEYGLAALPGQETRARAAIDQAVEYAAAIGTPNIHVMAGIAQGQKAYNTFIENLFYATSQANKHNITMLIEPLNRYDVPGYFLQSTDQAENIIEKIGVSNLKLLFDCYHVQIMEGDISRRLLALQSIIGHIQIASVPDRTEPDVGELNYQHLLQVLENIGYDRPIGAEYHPRGTTQAGLGWMDLFR